MEAETVYFYHGYISSTGHTVGPKELLDQWGIIKCKTYQFIVKHHSSAAYFESSDFFAR